MTTLSYNWPHRHKSFPQIQCTTLWINRCKKRLAVTTGTTAKTVHFLSARGGRPTFQTEAMTTTITPAADQYGQVGPSR